MCLSETLWSAATCRRHTHHSHGAERIPAPDGGDTWAPAKRRPDETLIRALARAHRWKRMLEEGRYRSAAEIAEAEAVTRSFVNGCFAQ